MNSIHRRKVVSLASATD